MTDTQCNITAVCYLKPFYAVAVIACENQRYKHGAHYYEQGNTAVYHNIRYQAVTLFLRCGFPFRILRRGRFNGRCGRLWLEFAVKLVKRNYIIVRSFFKQCLYIIDTACFVLLFRLHIFISFQISRTGGKPRFDVRQYLYKRYN